MSLNQKNENFQYFEIREGGGCFCFIIGKVRMARNKRKKTLPLKFMKKGGVGWCLHWSPIIIRESSFF